MHCALLLQSVLLLHSYILVQSTFLVKKHSKWCIIFIQTLSVKITYGLKCKVHIKSMLYWNFSAFFSFVAKCIYRLVHSVITLQNAILVEFAVLIPIALIVTKGSFSAKGTFWVQIDNDWVLIKNAQALIKNAMSTD